MTAPEQTQDRLGALPFVIGGISFIPLIGVPFGIAALTWSLFTKKRGRKRLALIGAAGILFTILLYGGLFYFGFVERGGAYDELRVSLTKSMLNGLVPAIEGYKEVHGHYPDSLDELRASLPKDSVPPIPTNDPSLSHMGDDPVPLYYQRSGDDHYYLLSVGKDRKPFTADDVLPDIDPKPGEKWGLLVDQKGSSP